MQLSHTDSITNIPADTWNVLAGDTNPFVQHDFLLALEQHDCLHPYGWHPQYLLAHDNGQLIGAAPAYIKTNSYGEFVFDWSWADVYQRHGLDYYPKLVIAVPYTPANGPRILSHPDVNHQAVGNALVEYSKTLCDEENLSTAHWLFCPQQDIDIQKKQGLLERIDCQYHWQNHQYENFEHFLSELRQKKRKNIRQERRKVTDANIQIDVLHGEELNEQQWQQLYDFYRITFMKKSGAPTLSLAFFKAIKHKVLAFMASYHGDTIAGAICIKGKHTLYGRHWGSFKKFDSLHFEVCYYTGIEYCIKQGLKTFEPGAQGEHKILRGFLPVITRSTHWIEQPQFRDLLGHHLEKEYKYMFDYYQDLCATTPYKEPMECVPK